MGQEKPDKNAHVSTANTAMLPSLSDTIHSPPPQFIQNQAPIHFRVINFMIAIIIHEKSISNASEN